MVASEFQSKMAFVVGFTGATGKEVVKELLQRKIFRKLILIGRRQAHLDGDLYKDTEQRLVDFDNLDQHKSAFDGCSVGFCCLGNTRAKLGKAGYVIVDHDYIVNVARIAREQGCQHFSVVSAHGANKDSWILYARIKGQMEADVADLGFPRFSIFQPGLILCDREEAGIAERLAKFAAKPFVWAMPGAIAVHANSIAKAMIADLFRKNAKPVEIIKNREIYQMAIDFDK